MNFIDMINLLADRPECEHGLNGPCRFCGPAASIEDTLRWKTEIQQLGVTGEDFS